MACNNFLPSNVIMSSFGAPTVSCNIFFQRIWRELAALISVQGMSNAGCDTLKGKMQAM